MRHCGFILIACLFWALDGWAQGLGSLMSPHGHDTQIQAEALVLPDNKEFAGSWDQVLFKGEKHQINLNGRYRDLRFDHPSNLPDHLETLEGGLQYTHHLEEGRFWAIQARYGSASDKLFEDKTVSTVSANVLYRASARWMFLANYSNNRTFLNNIPLPSFMYAHTMTREKTLLIGLPFFFYRTPISENLSFSYNTIIPYTHQLNISYRFHHLAQAFLGADQKVETYLRFDRLNRKDRLFLVRRTVHTGVKVNWGRLAELNLKLGHAFGQRYYEAESFSKRGQVVERLDDGLFYQATFNLNF